MRKISVLAMAFSLAPAASLAAGIPAGTYVGGGDGAITVLHVTPQQRVLLGAFGQMGSSGGSVQSALAPDNDPFHGVLRSLGADQYEIRFSVPYDHAHPYCKVRVRYDAQKQAVLSVPPEHPVSQASMAACVQMHGANWGYGFSSSSTYVLRK